jgi:DNA-binding transcriptional ArsR family regulator
LKLSELTEIVQDIADRVRALEAGPPRSGAGPARAALAEIADLGLVQSMIAELTSRQDTTQAGTVVYAGVGHGADGLIAWQMSREWDVLVGADPAALASTLAALGSPQRVQIMQLLVRGALTTAEMTERLDGPSSGQLFHHLKELLAAGLIHQPARGTYAVRHQHVVAILVVLSAAIDLHGVTQADAP